ncbi:hypothetical protein R3P38DRAFT_3453432 [Favolaschia claudopus]|uniref:DUF6589 domain-containing protein n=1 Tax=Favolaschia claudopus TaxID=2862362 RepID=A0AAW0CQ48_9AGAR
MSSASIVDDFEPRSPVAGLEDPEDPEIDSEDEYYNVSQEILHDEINPSRPPSPAPSLHDEADEPIDEEEDSAPVSPFVLRTRRLRAVLDDLPDEEVVTKLSRVLDVLDENGLDVALFLETLCWGRECAVQNPRIRYARTAFTCSDELPLILKRCLKPPRWNSSMRKKRAKGGRAVLPSVVVEACLDMMHDEMREIGPLLTTETATDVRASTLTGFTFVELHKSMLQRAPTLVAIMNGLYKNDPSPMITVTAVSELMYRHNRRFNLLQKTFAVYFKFKGLSHTWISDAVRRMSKMSSAELADLVTKHPWILTYDNVVILFKVFSQRLDNLQKLNSGTAATVYFNPKVKPLPPSANAELKARRAGNLNNPMTGAELWKLMGDSEKQLRPFYIHTLLDFLLNSAEFDLENYPFADHQLLMPLERLNGLPTGKDAKWIQRLLGSVNQPEASYSDHEQLITEWLKQLRLMDSAITKDIGLNRVLFFLGDQLTVSRIRGLFHRRAGDDNSVDRLDYLVPVFGWLHFTMTVANSLHEQDLGRAKGEGLMACFNLLNRRGLHKTSTEGPFHAHLNEFLHHVAETHFREIWRTTAEDSGD